MCKETNVAILELLSQIHLEEVKIPGKFSIREPVSGLEI
jgi:hypothetical protein